MKAWQVSDSMSRPKIDEKVRSEKVKEMKEKYKRGIKPEIIQELADKCAKEFLKENGVFYDRLRQSV